MLSRSSGDGACAATGEGPAGQAGKCLLGIGVELRFTFNGEEIPEEGGVDGRSVCCCTTTVVMAADQAGIYVAPFVKNKRPLMIDNSMNDSCLVVYADQ